MGEEDPEYWTQWQWHYLIFPSIRPKTGIVMETAQSHSRQTVKIPNVQAKYEIEKLISKMYQIQNELIILLCVLPGTYYVLLQYGKLILC